MVRSSTVPFECYRYLFLSVYIFCGYRLLCKEYNDFFLLKLTWMSLVSKDHGFKIWRLNGSYFVLLFDSVYTWFSRTLSFVFKLIVSSGCCINDTCPIFSFVHKQNLYKKSNVKITCKSF